jgi:hypothetical protein
MTGENVFTITMAMIDEMLANGSLDTETTQEYRAKAPSILTMLQNELVGIDNRFRKKEDYIYPVAITSLNQTFQIDDIKASTLLTNGLAAQLMLHEDKTLANYFEQRYQEMKGMFLKPTPREPETREDKYDASLKF